MQTNEIGDRNASFFMARSRLKRVEELLDTISFLKSSLETCVSNLRQHMPKRTLTDLSNELLVFIFRLLEPDVNTLSHLSAVCKRFRRLTISSPHLWARQTMSSHMSRSLINAIGSRSGALKLDAVILSPFTEYIASTMSKYCNRWTTVILYDFTRLDMRTFHTHILCAKLTSLEGINLRYLTLLPGEEQSHCMYMFDDDWYLPSLKTLTCFGTLPRCFSAAASILTSCSFTFNYILNLSDLTAVLFATLVLEDLDVTLWSVKNVDGNALVKCNLPALRKFCLRSDDTLQRAVEDLLEYISAPNVISLCINLKSGQICSAFNTSSCFLKIIKGMKDRHTGLETLDLRVTCRDRDDGDLFGVYDIRNIFKALPKGVEYLTFSACNIRLHVGRRAFVGNFRKLQSVSFRDCNCLDTNFFDHLAVQLRKQRIELDTIYISDCREVGSKEYVREEKVETIFGKAGILDKGLDSDSDLGSASYST